MIRAERRRGLKLRFKAALKSKKISWRMLRQYIRANSKISLVKRVRIFEVVYKEEV